MTVSTGNIVKCIAQMQLAGQTIQNVYLVKYGGTTSDDNAVGDMAAWMEAIYGEFLSQLSGDLSFDQIHVYNQTADADLGIVPWPTLTGGGYSNDPLPTGVAACLTLPTAKLGTRGRKFYAGFGEGDTALGLFNSGVTDALIDAAAFLINGVVGDTSGESFHAGVLDKFDTWWPFVNAFVSNVPAYQRRRKQGVGI